MARRVAEAGDLLGLGPQVSDAVPHEIDERELPGTVLVAMSPTTTGMSGPLPVELVDHRLRKLDAAHRDATLDQGMATRPVPIANSSAGPSPASSAGIDRRLQHIRCEHEGRSLVVTLSRLCIPQVAAGH